MVGTITEHLDYNPSFYIAAAAAIIPLVVLPFVTPDEVDRARDKEAGRRHDDEPGNADLKNDTPPDSPYTERDDG
jgi:hypothetical protein